MTAAKRPRQIVYRFTPRGEQALDDLAAVLVNRMSERTPQGIADVLARVMHAPLEDLADALSAIAAQLPDGDPGGDVDAPTDATTTPTLGETETCPDCQAGAGEPCHVDCSSRWR